jgi:hypothetical protein
MPTTAAVLVVLAAVGSWGVSGASLTLTGLERVAHQHTLTIAGTCEAKLDAECKPWASASACLACARSHEAALKVKSCCMTIIDMQSCIFLFMSAWLDQTRMSMLMRTHAP